MPKRSGLELASRAALLWLVVAPVSIVSAWVPPLFPSLHSNGLSQRRSLPSRPFTTQLLSAAKNDGSSNNADNASSGCSVEFTDPATGCEVVLVGCFHGSQSSARDVQDVLTRKTTHVVVLELCANRFSDLRRDFVALEQEETEKATTTLQVQATQKPVQASASSRRAPWLVRFAKMVQETSQRQGWSTAAAAAVLGGVSGLQTALSGLQPGLEFTTALQFAAAGNGPEKENQNGVTIVLADQDVDEILHRLGRLPSMSLGMWKDFLDNTSNWKESAFGQQAVVLQTALMGTASQSQKVTLPGFLTRNSAAIRELVRLATPPVVLLQSLNLLAGWWFSSELQQQQQPPSMLDSITTTVAALAANAAFLGFIYFTVALPATSIILSERDDRLAEGMREACRRAGKDGRVVAVLGFLHVNGVAERLLHEQKQQ